MKIWSITAWTLTISAVLGGCVRVQEITKAAPAEVAANAASGFAVIPQNKDSDLKLYYADGRIVDGGAALERMQQDAKVVLWVSGNQFFAMDDVVREFQKQAPGIDVGLIPMPPGLILAAIKSGGWTY